MILGAWHPDRSRVDAWNLVLILMEYAMTSFMRAASVAAMLGLLIGGMPAPVAAAATPLCDTEMPSCAPHQGWYCFHEGMEDPLLNFCDPNDTGCLAE
jgi:hypothetical protein